MLVKYVKGKNGHLCGAVVAIDNGRTGWSACCPKDRFDKQRALSIATGCAVKGSNTKPPHFITPHLEAMKERSEKYFKF